VSRHRYRLGHGSPGPLIYATQWTIERTWFTTCEPHSFVSPPRDTIEQADAEFEQHVHERETPVRVPDELFKFQPFVEGRTT